MNVSDAELVALIKEQGEAFNQFKAAKNEEIRQLTRDINEVAKKANRPYMGGGAGGSFGHSPEDFEEKKSFLSYLRSGRENGLALKSMSTDSSPDGGYAIPRMIDDVITKTLRDFSPMRQLARVVTVETGDFSMLHSVGGTGYSWVGERQSRPQTDTPQFREIKPPEGEIYSLPGVTQRLLDDAGFDLESWLTEELSEAFAEGEGAAFISGDGINKPRGFLTSDISSAVDGTRPETALQYIASGGSGDFTATTPADKLIKLVYSLKPAYRKNAAWLMNSNTLEEIRKFKNENKDYIWKAGIEAGQPSTLLGYPVFEDENMPDVQLDSLSIAFGNFLRGYTIVDRNSSMLRDPFTAKPNVLFYSVRRVGGCVRDYRAIKVMKFASS